MKSWRRTGLVMLFSSKREIILFPTKKFATRSMTNTNTSETGAARALYYVAPRVAELRPANLSSINNSDSVIVKALWSGISRGTEKLVFEGQVPESEFERMRAPFQEGSFPFPVKYGYSVAGVVVGGAPDLIGRKVFTLHPHQTLFSVPRDAVAPLPGTLPARRAILAANMETALNAMWDSGAGPGDKIVIIGAGAVGLLVTSLAARLPGAEVLVCDIDPAREAIARALGASFSLPDALGNAEADVVFHASGTPSGLATALVSAGFEARIIELSWYGSAEVPVPLGTAFHSKRLRLISSQVGAVSDSRRARWTHTRRLAKALLLLVDDRLDALITDEVAFDELPDALPGLLSPRSSSITTAIRYADSQE
jgi:2-desacetyl-2-hydroxyethyl bacteriochlorophyllide A dehydrogenase